MAEKYGQSPASLVFDKDSISIMEQQLFNMFILNVGLKEEARINKSWQKKRQVY